MMPVKIKKKKSSGSYVYEPLRALDPLVDGMFYRLGSIQVGTARRVPGSYIFPAPTSGKFLFRHWTHCKFGNACSFLHSL